MAKFKKLTNTRGQYIFNCPGCKLPHSVMTAKEDYQHPIWTFNVDVEKPTITPSLLVRYPANPNASSENEEWRKERICHSFITDGNIQFLSDCTHSLAGQTVELPEME